MIVIRSAKPEDIKFLLELRNDSKVHRYFWENAAITEEDHREWVKKTLNDPSKKIYIYEQEGRSIGQVRFDITGDETDINISLISFLHGRGYGTTMLELAEKELKKSNPRIGKIKAYIDPENIASIKLFKKSGYGHEKSVACKNRPAIKIVKHI